MLSTHLAEQTTVDFVLGAAAATTGVPCFLSCEKLSHTENLPLLLRVRCLRAIC